MLNHKERIALAQHMDEREWKHLRSLDRNAEIEEKDNVTEVMIKKGEYNAK